MMNKGKLFLIASAFALLSTAGAANAATVPAPIYNQNHTIFGTNAVNVGVGTPTAGNFRFTVTDVGSPGTPFPPFNDLGFTVSGPTGSSSAGLLGYRTTPGSLVLSLAAAQTYFVNVIGMASGSAFLHSGTFNLEVVQVIPIPAAAVLFSSALMGLVVVARRRNKTGEVVAA